MNLLDSFLEDDLVDENVEFDIDALERYQAGDPNTDNSS